MSAGKFEALSFKTLIFFFNIFMFHLAWIIHKYYIFQYLWVIQVNPDIENVGFHFS